MMEFLLFRIYAPLAAWGDVAVGELRKTLPFPSCSAVLGLVSAALGIRREAEAELKELQAGLGLGLKILGAPRIMEDFHTSQKSSKFRIWQQTRRDELRITPGRQPGKLEQPATVLSYRQYVLDQVIIAALYAKHGSSYSLQRIKQDLHYPHFTLYAGRKSCPLAAPLQPQIVEAESLKAAFDQASFAPLVLCYKEENKNQMVEERRLEADPVQYLWEEGGPAGMDPAYTIQLNDSLLSRQRWQYEPHRLHVAAGQVE